MGKQFKTLTPAHADFISRQKLFFVGTAAENGRVNVSPKGMDTLRIVDDSRVVWLNVTGSGNETAAHVKCHPRMTIMFCAFAGEPLILRLYGEARAIHRNDPEWGELYALFSPLPGARQIFDMSIELVQSSCGMGVPYFSFEGEREQLNNWAEKKGDAGIRQYWLDKNRQSIDGLPTDIEKKNI